MRWQIVWWLLRKFGIGDQLCSPTQLIVMDELNKGKSLKAAMKAAGYMTPEEYKKIKVNRLRVIRQYLEIVGDK